MAPPTPRFPALEAWQEMDEGAQDALISRIEAHNRRRIMVGRLVVGIACAVLVIFGLYVMLD